MQPSWLFSQKWSTPKIYPQEYGFWQLAARLLKKDLTLFLTLHLWNTGYLWWKAVWEDSTVRNKASWSGRFVLITVVLLGKLQLLPQTELSYLQLAGVCALRGSTSSVAKVARYTIAYYASTTITAVILGIVLVNIIQPGRGNSLGQEGSAGCSQVQEVNFPAGVIGGLSYILV